MRIEAGLAFGSIAIGTSADRVLRIYNEGNSLRTVTPG